MATISIIPISAFDAYHEQQIGYVYSGNQSIKNRLIIYDNETNAVVYDDTQSTLKLSHLLPAGTLENGKTYNCSVTAYDIGNNEVTSSKIIFQCLSTPIWGFFNIVANQIIRNAAYTVNIEYKQLQNELLNEYKLTLYSSAMVQIWDSGVKYGSVVPIEIGGLSDNGFYYIRATGRTVNGFFLDTGFLPFSVEYEATALYSVLVLENKKNDAAVKITSNIVVITGKSIPDDITYIDHELVDLRQNGHSVSFDEGFDLNGNFLIDFVGYGFNQNQSMISLSDKWETVDVYWRKGEFENSDGTRSIHTFAELKTSDTPVYVIFSNHLNEDINDTDMLRFIIKRINGLYEIRIYKYNW